MGKRQDAVMEFIETYVNTGIPTIPGRISANLKECEARAMKAALTAFMAVCGEALRRQGEGSLGDIIMINFSFLWVGIAQGEGRYRIDVCDEGWLTAEEPCAGFWDADFAFDPYFELIGEWKQKLHSFGRGVREVDIDHWALVLSTFPQTATNAFLSSIAPIMGANPSYLALSRQEGCVITAGEYRDAQTVIYPYAAEGA